MISLAFNITLTGEGPGKNAYHPLCPVVWCGAAGTQLRYNPKPAAYAFGHTITLFYVDGVQIGQLDTALSDVPATITHNGVTYTVTLGRHGREELKR